MLYPFMWVYSSGEASKKEGESIFPAQNLGKAERQMKHRKFRHKFSQVSTHETLVIWSFPALVVTGGN